MASSIKMLKAQKLLLNEMMSDDNICNHGVQTTFIDDSKDLMIGNGYFGFRVDKQNLLLNLDGFEKYPIFDVVNMNNVRDLVFAGAYNINIRQTNRTMSVYCFVTADVGIAKHYFDKKYIDIFNMEYVEYHYKKGICIITDAKTLEIIGYVLEIERIGDKND